MSRRHAPGQAGSAGQSPAPPASARSRHPALRGRTCVLSPPAVHRERTAWNALGESDVPDVLGPGLTAIFCGINPGRVSAAANAHFANPRNDFWRLLHAAGFTPRLYEPERAVRAAPARHRRHQRRLSHHAGLRRPAQGRLRRLGRAARADRARARAARDRLRRQGGVSRRLRRAAGARAARAPPRRDGALRASLDLARQRRGAVGRAAALVSGLLRRRLDVRSPSTVSQPRL